MRNFITRKYIVVVAVVFIIIVLFCVKIKVKYPFIYDTTYIQSIELVRWEGYDTVRQGPQLKTIRIIEDTEGFLEAFLKVDCFHMKFANDREGFHEDDFPIIKITYDTGEYELIGKITQASYTYSRGFYENIHYVYFDKEDLLELVRNHK